MGDNDFPAAMANPGVGFLQSYLRGFEDYSQKGDDIPSFRFQEKYGKEQGGPLVGEQLISRSPSFSIPPDIDSPVVDKWIQEYKSQPGYTEKALPNIKQNIENMRKRYSHLFI